MSDPTRSRTRIWRGGLPEILADSQPEEERADSEPVPEHASGFRPTRVLSVLELRALRRAQRPSADAQAPSAAQPASPQEPADAPSPRLDPLLGQPSSARVGLRDRLGWIALAFVALALVALCVRRAPSSKKARARAALSAHNGRPSQVDPAPPGDAREASNRVARVASGAALPPGQARQAVDALAAGDDSAAARAYRELARHAAEPAVFESAAEILHERARSEPARALNGEAE